MTKHFLNLEWKQFFRSSFFAKGIAIKIILGFFALYFLVSALATGIGGYFILKKAFPETDPFLMLNKLLLFGFVIELLFRYLMQKLPVMQIKPLLILPISRKKIVHFVLKKSIFSFFNVLPLFIYVPFGIVLIVQGYNTIGTLAWLFFVLTTTVSINYLNFLINKNNIALGVMIVLLLGLLITYNYQLFPISDFFGAIFYAVYQNPILILVGVLCCAVLYFLNYKELLKIIYLDKAVQAKTQEAKTADLSFVDKLGDIAPFIKNDMRLIWRNKRTKTVFFMSFLFLFYGVIFMGNEVYEQEMPVFLVFASLFVTGGFTLNYGQFIPSWESSYYKLIMSQRIRYRKFIESKWMLMVIMTFILYILSIPYLYYGIDKFLMITAGAVFNIGFNSLFLLWAGTFKRKPIKLNTGGFGNTQGTSATQFLVIIPVMGVPMLLFWIFSKWIGCNAGILAIAFVGLFCLIFRNFFLDRIVKKYIKDKYKAIQAFSEKK